MIARGSIISSLKVERVKTFTRCICVALLLALLIPLTALCAPELLVDSNNY